MCSSCGATNPAGQRFCGECGARLASGCPACGATVAPDQRFCGDCGTAIAGVGASAAAAPLARTGFPGAQRRGPGPALSGPAAERRLVSVLFADLVGFTPFAEERDAELVRETLTRYFELASDVIGRYGGTVEKFIGDAVMAVWGVPVTLRTRASS
jgi:class 3 adenylate cyclase